MNAGMKTMMAGCAGVVMALGLSAWGEDNLLKTRPDWPTLKAEAWFPANPELDAGKPADYIAVDTAKTYKLGCWLFAKTQDTRLSFGLAMYDAGKRLIAPPVGKYVWIVEDIPVSPVDWVEYTKKISGEGANTLAFLPGTKFVRVVLWLKTGQVYFGTQFVTFTEVAQSGAPISTAPAVTNAVQPKPASAYYDSAGKGFVYQVDGKLKAVETQADWALCRKMIIRNMEEVMGPLPLAGQREPPGMKVLEERSSPAFVMKKIAFSLVREYRVEAWLFVPTAGKQPRPAMLCLHQSNNMLKDEPAGISGKTNYFYARELAEQGYVTLAPDFFVKGAGAYNQGYVSATMFGVWNHMRAVDLLQSLPEVDPQRIGCIGHSLGGINTLALAAFDERIKVAVISAGFTNFRKYGDLTKYPGGFLKGWAGQAYMPRIESVYGNDPAIVPFNFDGVLACLAPRPVLINAPIYDGEMKVSGVEDCVAAAKTVYGLFDAVDRMTVLYPKTYHDFPPEVRKAFYEKLAVILKP